MCFLSGTDDFGPVKDEIVCSIGPDFILAKMNNDRICKNCCLYTAYPHKICKR